MLVISVNFEEFIRLLVPWWKAFENSHLLCLLNKERKKKENMNSAEPEFVGDAKFYGGYAKIYLSDNRFVEKQPKF